MTSISFETTLHQHLTPFFEAHQFRLLNDKKHYRKATEIGFQQVVLTPTFYANEIILDIRLACRNEQVEQIAQQFLTNQALIRPDTSTLHVPIGQFNDFFDVRLSIRSEKEIHSVCQKIEHFFTTVGFDFLSTACTLPALDRLLNGQLGQPSLYVYNQMHRCYKGLITASLNHNTQFDHLIDTYRHLLIHQTQNRHEQIRFEQLIAYLQYYSAN